MPTVANAPKKNSGYFIFTIKFSEMDSFTLNHFKPLVAFLEKKNIELNGNQKRKKKLQIPINK